jgi:acetyl esterase/lipase
MDLVALVDDLRQAVRTASGQCAPISCADLRQATQSLRNLLGCEPARCSEQLLRKASPITYVTPASPPFFLANSTAELVPATQASAMATALRSANVPVDLELVPGDEHSVQYVPSIRRSLMAFLTAHVGSGSADTVNAVPNPPRDGQRPGWFRPWVVVAAALFLLALMTAFRRRSAGRARVTPRQRSERPPRAEAGQSAPR